MRSSCIIRKQSISMPTDLSRFRRGSWAGLLSLLSLSLIAGCSASNVQPTATSSARDFTVLVTGGIDTVDPAEATEVTDSILITAVYQRLMQVTSGGDLKPDAATDCAFTSQLVYECTLPDTLRFQNGDVLDSSDVRFSIQRALRLDVPGTSIGLLSSLTRVEAPTANTVRFVLSRPDNQFGYALAGQATSIVDEQVYDSDTPLDLKTLPVGSGAYSLSEVNADGATFEKYSGYVGPTSGQLDHIKLRVAADSIAAESAIEAGEADVAWNCLDSAAQQRISNEMSVNGNKTASGFTQVALPGVKVTRLTWSPNSAARNNALLRDGVAKALQPDRTLDSIVPLGNVERSAAFPIGGRAKLPKINTRTTLTLGYDDSDPTQADVARRLRDAIEQLDGVSVRVTTSTAADLYLSSHPAWINNALGWLQIYLDAPLPASAAKLVALEAHARNATGTARTADLSELQQQAAADLTVLPVSQESAFLLIGSGVSAGSEFSSGQQLALTGFNRA
jgi:peptide/nickel transport system substrate-binding protein